MKKQNYSITFSYKAVITVNVKAASEDEAKELAKKDFSDKFRRAGANNINTEDDTYSVEGIINMDKTWNAL
jgi:hypothetical protein